MIPERNHSSKKDFLGPKPIVADFLGTPNEIMAYRNAIAQSDFINARTFRDQLRVLFNFMHNDTFRVSFERIAGLFGVTKQAVYNQYLKVIKQPLPDGRPPTLSDDELAIVANEIDRLHMTPSNPIYPSYVDIFDFVNLRLNKSLQMDTLRHIIRTKLNHKFKTCLGLPLEVDRADVNLDDIERNLEELKEKIKGVPSCFIFNLDECGYSDYADARERQLIVPITYTNRTVTYPVTRKMSHSSVLAAISPCGIAAKPLFTVQRATVDSELYNSIPLNSLDIVQTESGFVNSSSFRYWMEKDFIPYVRNLRKQHEYNGKAIVIMDGFVGHYNGIETLDLEKENIVIHFLVPHSSDMLQPLDVGIFSPMKRFASNIKAPSNSSILTKQLIKMHQSLMHACTPINCKSAFKAVGITTDVVKKGQSFQEIVDLDITKCSKVRFFEFGYIEQRIKFNLPITEIQRKIYFNKIYPELEPKSFRIPLVSCANANANKK